MAATDVAASETDRKSLWWRVKRLMLSNNRVHVSCGVHGNADSWQSTELRALHTDSIFHVGVGTKSGSLIRTRTQLSSYTCFSYMSTCMHARENALVINSAI